MTRARRRSLSVPSADHLVVYGTLLLWWMAAPLLFDDGFFLATIANYQPDGESAAYYVKGNGAYPFGYLHFMILRLVWSISSDLIWLRVPSLVAGLATWHVSRATLDRVLRRSGRSPSRAVHMVLAGGLLLGWISFNSGLRAEPWVALMSASGLWAATRFSERLSGKYLLVGAATVVVATSVHPGGVVTLAPWVPLASPILRWLRRSPLQRVTIIAAIALVSVTALVLLVWGPLGRDGWAYAVRSFAAEGGHSMGWSDEHARYLHLYLVGNAVRRLAVMLPAMGVLFMAFRRRRERDPISELVMWAAIAGLLLLALTPSKWMWHFGGLAPVAAAALALGWERWREAPLRESMWVRSIVLLAVLVTVNSVGWYDGALPRLGEPVGAFYWGPGALREVGAIGLFNALLDLLALPGFWVGAAVMAGGLAVLRARATGRSSSGGRLWPRGAVTWMTGIALGVAVLLPVSTFTVDGLALAPGWSLAKQNLDAGFGSTCGLAEELRVSVGGGGPSSLQSRAEELGGTVFVVPQLRMYFPCLEQPAIVNGVAEIPDLVVCAGSGRRSPLVCDAWEPLSLEDSPLHGLPDVAILTPLVVDWSSPEDSTAIHVNSVEIGSAG